MSKAISIKCHIDSTTGYGQTNCGLIQGFQEAGINTVVTPTTPVVDSEVPDNVYNSIVNYSKVATEFLIHVPSYKTTPNKVTARYTLWETTQLNPKWVAVMNKEACVLTASDWNATAFTACGITTPIYKIPLFIDNSLYKLQPLPSYDKFIFGCGGRVAMSHGKRKGLEDVINAFQLAFPTETDVELHIKITPECEPICVIDNRVVVDNDELTHHELYQWYKNIHVYVSGSRAEGWGLMQHQAMATGRPIISTRYGGLAEFVTAKNSFVISHGYSKPDSFYTGLGHWSEPSVSEMVDKMKYVYHNHNAVQDKALLSTDSVKVYSRKNTMTQLIPILENYAIIN